MEANQLVIAIDGQSSSGKSTLAKAIAKALGLVHIDSGAMYRALTLYAMRYWGDKLTQLSAQELEGWLQTQYAHMQISFVKDPQTQQNQTHLNQELVESEIRTMEVSNRVSKIAQLASVRTFLIDQQRLLAAKGGVVMDGRDIGSNVLPNAQIKLFVTTSIHTRVQRRLEELKITDPNVTYQEVEANLKARDFDDENRSLAPLIQADDAMVIKNEGLTKEEVLEQAMKYIQKALLN
ncbi:unnamed protein product [Notodromas monacha]|uniref:(d)CMP kinase n=1 Tax=Notodromas monacha TaxID=399045 RepID=A0A7R9GK88_9CRUS|nr:unnamed protein product [Notodromas monacha]CAG0925650.1 unnamed protein product [Notodromas monacha]